MSGQYNVDNGIYLYEHAGGARVAYMTMGMDEPTFQSHAGRGWHMGDADGGDDSSEEDLDSRGGDEDEEDSVEEDENEADVDECILS